MKKLVFSALAALSVCGAFAKSKDIYIRPLKVRVIDAETKKPVPGLKIYNILSIEDMQFAYLFWIPLPQLCFGNRQRDAKEVLLGEYTTDENGEARLLEASVKAKRRYCIKNQLITINTELTDKSEPDEKKVYRLGSVDAFEPETDSYTFRSDNRYKNAEVIYRISEHNKNCEKFYPYLQQCSRYYNLRDNTGLGYCRYRSFECDEDEITVEIQRREPSPSE